MNIITASDLHKLAVVDDQHCVSIYMPTYPTRQEGQQDSLRLDHLVSEAEQQLVNRGLPNVEARQYLKPVVELRNHAKWPQRRNGLAIFRSPKSIADYWIASRFAEKVNVGRSFYIRPLLPIVVDDSPFFILAVSRNHVRLLKATQQQFQKVFPVGLPTSMEQVLNIQSADRGEQVHSALRGDLGKEAGVFHGQGGHRDTIKDELAEYMRIIDESVRTILHQIPGPVILAGVKYELAIFRRVSSCSQITDDSLYGCFDHVDDRALFEEALPIARKFGNARRHQALEKFQTMAARLLTSDDVEEIVPAAHEGRIDTLFVETDARIFGCFDADTNNLEMDSPSDASVDLVELAIMETIKHSGTVYTASSAELPSATKLCAILRYN